MRRRLYTFALLMTFVLGTMTFGMPIVGLGEEPPSMPDSVGLESGDEQVLLEEQVDDSEEDAIIALEYIPLHDYDAERGAYVFEEGIKVFKYTDVWWAYEDGGSEYVSAENPFYEYIFSPDIGDQLIVRYANHAITLVLTTYGKDEGVWHCLETGEDYPREVVARRSDASPRHPWTPESGGTVTFQYEGSTVDVPVIIEPTKIDHIAYRPKTPYSLSEYDGWTTLNASGGALERVAGDQLVLVLRDGSEDCYTLTTLDGGGMIYEDAADRRIDVGDVEFADLTWEEYVQGRDTQGICAVHYGWFETDFDVVLTANIISEAEYVPKTPLTLREGIDGWMETTSVQEGNDWVEKSWFRYSVGSSLPKQGDNIIFTSAETGAKTTYAYDISENYFYNVAKVGSNGKFNYDRAKYGTDYFEWVESFTLEQSYENQLEVGRSYLATTMLNGKELVVRVAIIPNPVASISFIPKTRFVATDDNEWNIPAFVPGDELLVTYNDGRVDARYVYVGIIRKGSRELDVFRNSAKSNDLINRWEIEAVDVPDNWRAMGYGDHRSVKLTYSGQSSVVDVDVIPGITHAKVVGPFSKAGTGAAFTPNIKVVLNGKTLVKGKDYALSFNMKNDPLDDNRTSLKMPGTYRICVSGVGIYSDNSPYKAYWFTVKAGKQTVQASDKTVKVNKTVKLSAKASGGGKLSYHSSNSKVCTVNSNGVVKGLKAGKAKITIKAAKTKTWKAGSKTIIVTVKKENTLTAKATKATVGASSEKLSMGDVVLANNVKVSKAKGAVSFKNVSTGAKAKTFVVDAKTGKVTVPAEMAAGSYTVTIKVTANGNSTYLAASKTVSYKVVVK